MCAVMAARGELQGAVGVTVTQVSVCQAMNFNHVLLLQAFFSSECRGLSTKLNDTR